MDPTTTMTFRQALCQRSEELGLVLASTTQLCPLVECLLKLAAYKEKHSGSS